MSPRGRGRPVNFDQTAREQYLTAVASGLPLADAAATVGITPQWANRVAATDPSFHTARDLAKKEGKRVRAEQLAHGEYRYNHHGCRCGICCTEASQARTERRHAAAADATAAEPQPPPEVIDLPQLAPGRGPSEAPPLLARAS
ncbi:hypothetical protein AB0933_32570 [Streptomyces venezuelae]|uniref:hypothetical protein n=1 Tax=Streptomyces venezuelae TaxID=54571 RepID=UPI003455DF84